MKVLITGGAGFIGSALARSLLDRGDEVRVLDSLRHGARQRVPEGAEFIEGDVRNRAVVDEAVSGRDAVLHLASIAGVSSVEASPIEVMDVGFNGTRNVLVTAVAEGVDGVVNFSSSEVYGSHASALSEDAPTPVPPPTDPRWGYAAVKLAAEHLTHAFSRRTSLWAANVRIFNTYGPGQLGDGAVNNFVRAVVAGEPIQIRDDGASVRTWCYITDTVDAVLCVLGRLSKISGETFNIGNPFTVATTCQLADAVCAAAGRRLGGYEYVAGGADVRVRIPNIDKAMTRLYWEPKVDLAAGLKMTYESHLRHLVE